MTDTPDLREEIANDFKRHIVQALVDARYATTAGDLIAGRPGHEHQAHEVADIVLGVLPDSTRRLLDSCTLHRTRAETAEKQRDEALADGDDAHATLGYCSVWVADLLDDYGLGRPDGLAGGLDQIGEAFRLASWLHAEKVWQLTQAEASRRDWAAEAARLNDFRPQLVDKDDPSQVCFGTSGRPGECTQRSSHLFGCPSGPNPEPQAAICACPTPEQAAALLATGRFSLPVCSVHPTGGEA